MRFGYVLPGGSARFASEAASLAEDKGWDGFFVWEPVWGVDAWISLSAAAMVTQRIRLGTMISPLSRMRPWKIASETATLDQLSDGRVILSVGLGALETGFFTLVKKPTVKRGRNCSMKVLISSPGCGKANLFNTKGSITKSNPRNLCLPHPPFRNRAFRFGL